MVNEGRKLAGADHGASDAVQTLADRARPSGTRPCVRGLMTMSPTHRHATRSLRVVLAAVLAFVAVAGAFSAAPAGADGVEVPGREVRDLGYNRFCHETRLRNGALVPGLDTLYGQTWQGPRRSGLASAPPTFTVTDGTVTVTVTGFTGTSFDWSSDIPLDGVFVNAGTAPHAAHRFYRYDPETTSDTGLTSADATTPIDHIQFCYDVP